MITGAVNATLAVWELPFSDAVTVALWSDVNEPAVRVNEADVADIGTVTEEGAVREAELLVRATVVLFRTAELRLTAQVVVIPELRLLLPHVTEVTVTGVAPETLPPAVETPHESPSEEASEPPLTCIETLLTPKASVTAMLANTPLAMIFAFKPVARQVYEPEPALQVTVLSAAMRAGPAVTATEVTLLAGYASVH
jgi:hypothetical protein